MDIQALIRQRRGELRRVEAPSASESTPEAAAIIREIIDAKRNLRKVTRAMTTDGSARTVGMLGLLLCVCTSALSAVDDRGIGALCLATCQYTMRQSVRVSLRNSARPTLFSQSR